MSAAKVRQPQRVTRSWTAALIAFSPATRLEPVLAAPPQPLLVQQPQLALRQLPSVSLATAIVEPSELSAKIQSYQAKYPAKEGDQVLVVAGDSKGESAVLLDLTPKGKFAVIKLLASQVRTSRIGASTCICPISQGRIQQRER